VHFFDADGLTGEHRTEIDFFLAQIDAAATSERRGLRQSGRQAGIVFLCSL
jgi:hypothetical protein